MSTTKADSTRPKNSRTLTLLDLFYLVSWADGEMSPKEEEMGKIMVAQEGIDPSLYESHLLGLASRTKEEILRTAVSGMKGLDRPSQIKVLAWVSFIANSDGFMDESEWRLIYQIYHTELKLDLKDILESQKEINRAVNKKDSFSMGVKVND